MLLSLIARGFGATLLPSSVLSLHNTDHYRTSPIADNPWMLQPTLICPRGHYLSRAARAFWELAKELHTRDSRKLHTLESRATNSRPSEAD